MRTVRLICVFVVLLGFSGCIRTLPWSSDEVVLEKGNKSVEGVEAVGDASEVVVEALPEVEKKTTKVAIKKRAIIVKKEVLKTPGNPPRGKSLPGKKPVSHLTPPKLIKLGNASSGNGKDKRDVAYPKEVKLIKKAPEKKVKKSVSVKMGVVAVKPVNPKMSEGRQTVTSDTGVKVRRIIIPYRDSKVTSQFVPKVMRVKAGEKVMWVNQDVRTHFINKKPEISAFSVMVDVDDDDDDDEGEKPKDQGFANSPLITEGASWTQVFKKKGTYNYYCFTHPLEMRGTIIVE